MMNYTKLLMVGMTVLALLVIVQNSVLNARKAQIATLDTKINVLTLTNITLSSTVQTLKNMREIEQKLLVNVNANLEEINNKVNLQTKTLDQLEKTNAQLADYLNVALPDDVKRLLNGETDTGRPN